MLVAFWNQPLSESGERRSRCFSNAGAKFLTKKKKKNLRKEEAFALGHCQVWCQEPEAAGVMASTGKVAQEARR